jgi:EpsI family protein
MAVILPFITVYLCTGTYITNNVAWKTLGASLSFANDMMAAAGVLGAVVISLIIQSKPKKVVKSPYEKIIYHSDFTEFHWLFPLVVAYSIFLIMPWSFEVYRDIIQIKEKYAIKLKAPTIEGWGGPEVAAESEWWPRFLGADASFTVGYKNTTDKTNVFLFTSHFGYTNNNSLLNSENRFYVAEGWQERPKAYMKINLENFEIPIVEIQLGKSGTSKLIWYWYYVGTININEINKVPNLESVKFLVRSYPGSGVVAISTNFTDNLEAARDTLKAFLKDLAPHLPDIIDPRIYK